MVSLLISCDNTIDSPYAPSVIAHYNTVENLQANTLYYLKVVAIGTKGINSESAVQTFKTYD